ncbi:hypothetical protein [Paenibacillus sp. Marseille-Q4541]|uniref:hypothetical protein n=1 Tax=Paenibacillus sp. Marseille-Q4541 TaxID=2831522 RepID=UPI001BAD4D14|nr:hypothetical protein [Paenibacillus sp. Marseille-Q4541]
MSEEYNQEDMALPSSFLSKENEVSSTNVIVIPHYTLDIESVIDSYVNQSQSLATKKQLKLLLQDLWVEAERHGKILEMINKIQLDINILQDEVIYGIPDDSEVFYDSSEEDY